MKRKYRRLNYIEHTIKFFLSWTLFRFLRKCHFVPMSNLIEQQFVYYFGYPQERFKVIYPFVETPPLPKEKTVSNKNSIKLLFAGQLLFEKGAHIAIEALSNLNKLEGNLRFHLDIIGTGEPNYEERLRKIVDIESLHRYVSFLGFVSREELLRRYSEYDIFLLPSLHLEPFGLVAIESMSRGLPVICSNKGGFLEVIDDNLTGLLFKQGSSEDLARKIKMLVSDEILYQNLRQNAYKRVRAKFDRKRYFGQMEGLLEEVRSNW